MGSVNARKIDLMYRLFGMHGGQKCKNCLNLISREWDKKYYKCSVYGVSSCEATDWRLSYNACGLFNKEWSGGRIVELVRSNEFKTTEEKPLDGQISFEEEI